MYITKQQFSDYIKQFNFRELFNDMGWNNDNTTQPIVLEDVTYLLKAVAEKSGFKIFTCSPDSNGKIPEYCNRKKIETKVTKLFQEHLIIYYDKHNQQQLWQLVVRQTGKPTRMTETRYHISQDPELLYQRTSGLFFTLIEEEKITIIDVTQKVTENFLQNNEKVTKKFYERFRTELIAFQPFIKGILDTLNRDWYASLMLNRLMFCYFIQKKGLLDENRNYLRDKLKTYKAKKGDNNFFSFYRQFLLTLFHDGLGAPNHDHELKKEIGNVPYLNGGLFDVHELENNYKDIDIEDRAFENIFNFFDEYEWHLDTRITSTGTDINPDVLGYIFEKYINDRADMGAYYTKEDITDYISKNSIIPFLFDETKRQYINAFTSDSALWQMVKHSNNKYIYSELKKGVDLSLPEEINKGIGAISDRTEWNKQALNDFALPTEIWREVIDRRNRYKEIQTKIEIGEITSINEFITCNLDIRQFAIDSIASTNDPEFLKSFYIALNNITILDPTCGSGAFLFAAMNILEELYEECINRMQNFVIEAPQKGKYKFFEDILLLVNSVEHPNQKYFIYKNIILRNLYGVDIMKEAVEIAKLRLFLKLVATADEVNYRKPNLGLEPLPDIDFNIRSGNSLVGFASKVELKTGSLDFKEDEKKVLEQIELVSKAFTRFKEMQLSIKASNSDDFKDAKDDYQCRLNELKGKLNHSYYNAFGDHKKDYNDWVECYKPFHWFVEFYEIIQSNGGFNVIIGNPPYLEVRQIDYEPKKLKTYSTGAVHSMCIERSLQILREEGNISMIVPLALVCTQRMVIVQNLLESGRTTWYSNFAWRPAKLFENVNRALTIFISNASTNMGIYATKYVKWQSDTRECLFPIISYTPWHKKRISFWIPKLGFEIESGILKKVLAADSSVSYIISSNSLHKVYYRTTGGLYWKIFTNFPPKFFVKGKEGKSSRETYFSVREKNQDIICVAIMSSNLFWWWYTITSNLRDLNPIDIQGFKYPNSILCDKSILELGREYLKDLENNSEMLTRIQKQTGETQTQLFKIKLSKHLLDEIDILMAKHYGFTNEEIDFIINYDIKYRMGKELEDCQDN